MRALRIRVRTLMIAVCAAALILWGAMMGSRSYDHFRHAREYANLEVGWRQIAARKPKAREGQFASECVQYFARLSAKYRRAMWHPWRPVAPDPPAPGNLEYQEQRRRAALEFRADAGAPARD